MSDCIHCDIHDLLEPELASEEADLVLSAAPEDRTALLADVIANLGHLVIEKGEQLEATGEVKPRRH